jgi:cell division protein FtsI/penicillin-binding protein 2
MHTRIQQLFLGFLLALFIIIIRLSYWQVIMTDELSLQASNQYLSKDISDGARGTILTQDGFPLVVNQAVYSLGAYMPSVVDKPDRIVSGVMPLLNFEIKDAQIATDSASSQVP